MDTNLIDLIGLVFALIGAIVLACGLIISRKQALRVGVARYADDSDEQNICLPHVRDELRESRFSLTGLVFLIIGFLLQIVARGDFL